MDSAFDEVKSQARRLIAEADADLEASGIDEAEWYERVKRALTTAYLAGGNPRAESGHSGDEAHWERARSLVAEAIDRDGTFLDVGCANGYLMESVER